MVRQPGHRGNHASGSRSNNANEDSNFAVRGQLGSGDMRNLGSIEESRRSVIGRGTMETAGTSTTQRRRGCPPVGTEKRKLKSKMEMIINIEDDSESDVDDDGKWNATIISWLISSKTLQENARVCYIDQTDKPPIKEGIIKRDGILCSCCRKVFRVGDFQAHAVKNIFKPYENIFISGTSESLFSCMVQAWDKPAESRRHRFNHIKNNESVGDSYDDACIICADGGNLMCCDECTSTYHHTCMNMQEVPEDKWYCPYCACKFCGRPGYMNDYLLTCSLCDKKYHWECYRRREPISVDINRTPSPPFCETSCREVYEKLERNIGVRNELHDGYTWSLLQRIDENSLSSNIDLYRRVENHSKLAIAWKTMNACFEPIKDRHTKVDMIRSVVYNCGSNFNRVNFRTFYTAVLEKNDEIISVASLRIHGTKLAEMPFVATSEIYRHKGMCKRLMNGIESALRQLKVRNLIIPSTPEMVRNWLERYDFNLLPRKLPKEMVSLNMLMFHDSVRLRKNLLLTVNEADNRKNEDQFAQIVRCTPRIPDLNIEAE